MYMYIYVTRVYMCMYIPTLPPLIHPSPIHPPIHPFLQRSTCNAWGIHIHIHIYTSPHQHISTEQPKAPVKPHSASARQDRARGNIYDPDLAINGLALRLVGWSVGWSVGWFGGFNPGYRRDIVRHTPWSVQVGGANKHKHRHMYVYRSAYRPVPFLEFRHSVNLKCRTWSPTAWWFQFARTVRYMYVHVRIMARSGCNLPEGGRNGS